MKETASQKLQYEDEIDLRELFNTIVNNKKIIFLGTFIITVFAIIYVYSKTPIYEVKALIEIGSYKIDNNNNKIQIDNSSQLSRKLNILFIDIFKNEKDRISEITNISVPKKSKVFLSITAEAISNELAIDEINKVLSYVQNKHNISFDNIKSSKENSIKIIEKKLYNLKKIKKQISGDNVPPSVLLEILKLDERIDLLEDNKNNLVEQLNSKNYTNSQIVGKIISNDYPAKPKKMLIVIVAFIIGLILSIFLVFFLEFIKGIKKDN